MSGMQDCSDNPSVCKDAHSRECKIPTQIVYDDVKRFFSHSTSCHTSIVYVDTKGKTRHTSAIQSRKVDDDCYIHFSRGTNGFYFVYDAILNMCMAWAKEPLGMPYQAIVGNHFTIGFFKNKWNLHETVYTPFRDVDNYLLLSKAGTKHYNYRLDGNELRKIGRGTNHKFSSAKSVWKDIVCWRHDTSPQQPMHGGNMTPTTTEEHKHQSTIGDFLSSPEFSRYMKVLMKHCKEGQYGMMRLPYLNSDGDVERLCEYLYSDDDIRLSNLVVITNHEHRCTFMAANMFM